MVPVNDDETAITAVPPVPPPDAEELEPQAKVAKAEWLPWQRVDNPRFVVTSPSRLGSTPVSFTRMYVADVETRKIA